ncbi:MAG TPA: TMEM175 family protein [Candidatus Baltobacteraceae bacterium]|nr:TMEM175 family protein [Candidatus Baltobacteraceae bacterium]
MTHHRLEAYSDGIFTISATLLVLNFAVPIVMPSDNAMLMHRLIEQWPRLLAFLLSFGVTMNYWRLHSAMFRGVTIVDHTTVMWNLLLLAAAAFVPYATNVAGTYPTLPAAAVMYSLTLLLAGLFGLLLSNHLIASRAYGEAVPDVVGMLRRRIIVAVIMRVVGLGFAFFLPVVSYAIYWLVIIYYLFVRGADTYRADVTEHNLPRHSVGAYMRHSAELPGCGPNPMLMPKRPGSPVIVA